MKADKFKVNHLESDSCPANLWAWTTSMKQWPRNLHEALKQATEKVIVNRKFKRPLQFSQERACRLKPNKQNSESYAGGAAIVTHGGNEFKAESAWPPFNTAEVMKCLCVAQSRKFKGTGQKAQFWYSLVQFGQTWKYDNDNDNDTLRESQPTSVSGLALQAWVKGS